MGVRLDPTPLVASSDPDYRTFYQAVVEQTEALQRQMFEG